MAIDDNTSYELTGAQVKDLANKIKAKAADNIFVGATSAIPGSKGLVPAPQAGDDTKFLSGNGLWTTVSQYSLPIASSSTLGGIKVGNNLTIDPSTGVLDADGSTYTAGNGIDITNDVISIDTTVVAELSDVTTAVGGERTAREAADVNLQGQIDAISASSDVTDIVGTKAELNNYDTSTLGNNDIIKVLQDESMNDETTYYRWSTTTQTFTLIGEEGPYYTKSQTDALLNAKANTSDIHDATLTVTQNGTSVGTFTANSNTNTTIALTDTTYTAGNHIDITNDVITAEGYIWGDTLTSATTPTGTVTSGMIADGTIQASDIATGVVPVITMTDTDPGEGSPLAANHFIAVYEP